MVNRVQDVVLWVSLVAWTVAVSAVAQATDQAGQPSAADKAERDKIAAATLERICTVCHGLDLIAEGLRSREEWDLTFGRMRDSGAEGTPEEFQRGFEYVVRTYSTLNVNKATAKELESWLDEGDKVAEAVVGHRTANGPFKTIDDLKKVPGLDPQTIDARESRISF